MSNQLAVIRIRSNNLVTRDRCGACGKTHDDAAVPYWFFVEHEGRRDCETLCAHCADELAGDDHKGAVLACGLLVWRSDSRLVQAAVAKLIDAINAELPTLEAAMKAREKRRKLAEQLDDETEAF